MTSQDHLARPRIDLDHASLCDEKKRDGKQNEIHQREIPERPGRTREAAQPERFDYRYRHKKQKYRDAQAKKRGKARAMSYETELLPCVFYDLKTQAIADRLELRGITDHQRSDSLWAAAGEAKLHDLAGFCSR